MKMDLHYWSFTDNESVQVVWLILNQNKNLPLYAVSIMPGCVDTTHSKYSSSYDIDLIFSGTPFINIV